jgi:hypothetical protein
MIIAVLLGVQPALPQTAPLLGPTQTSRPVSNRSGYWGKAAVPVAKHKMTRLDPELP